MNLKQCLPIALGLLAIAGFFAMREPKKQEPAPLPDPSEDVPPVGAATVTGEASA